MQNFYMAKADFCNEGKVLSSCNGSLATNLCHAGTCIAEQACHCIADYPINTMKHLGTSSCLLA